MTSSPVQVASVAKEGRCLIQNTGSTTVYIGNSNQVSATDGLQLLGGASFSEQNSPDVHTWWAVCASTGTVVVLQ